MKELPLPLKRDMFEAAREGRKTNTRRCRGLAVVNENPDDWMPYSLVNPSIHIGERILFSFSNKTNGKVEYCKPPYWVGDRLWPKEALWQLGYFDIPSGKWLWQDRVLYDDDRLPWEGQATYTPGQFGFKRRHSMFMPKKYARLWLEVLEVRLERLQDISPADAKAEGDIERSGMPGYHLRGEKCHIDWFRLLWDRINGKTLPWDLNPWVWVIVFRRILDQLEVHSAIDNIISSFSGDCVPGNRLL